jgi:uncharacterized metal-binding protein
MILACSGGSNAGQLSNRAGVELTGKGVGKLFCIAGIGGQLGGFVQSAKDVPRMIVIDGCSPGCAKASLENARVPMKSYLGLTDLGIEKNKDLNPDPEAAMKVKKAKKENVGQNPRKSSVDVLEGMEFLTWKIVKP